jgi:hypothetical protein
MLRYAALTPSLGGQGGKWNQGDRVKNDKYLYPRNKNRGVLINKTKYIFKKHHKYWGIIKNTYIYSKNQ